MKRGGWLLLFVTAACNFDAAFSRYCRDNPNCRQDAAPEDAALATGQDSAPDLSVDSGQAVVATSRWHTCKDGCRDTEACSPSNVCVPVSDCKEVSDCPAGSGDCARVYPNDSSGPMFCTCTARSCKGDTRCHYLDRICEPDCGSDSECEAINFDPPRPHCDRTSGLCVQCLFDADCSSPLLPRCDPYVGVCAACQSSSDCSGRTDGLTECAAGVCVLPMSGGR
jgi:hypothetical protein